MTEKREPRPATVYEAAKYLRVHSATIWKWTREGLIKAHGGQRYRRWDLNELDEFMGFRSA